MIVRTLAEILGTDREVRAPNGNWTSLRFLLEQDGMGFSFHDTTIHAGTKTFIHYKHHVEAVYCIGGEGAVELIDRGSTIPLSAGTFYGLNKHEKHYLTARTDMRIICVFNPPLTGGEVHRADGSYAPPSLDKRKPRFVYLNLREQPRGNYMLDCLVRAGLEPVAVIEEDSSLAAKGYESLHGQLIQVAGRVPLPPALSEIIGDRDIPCLTVANHNDRDCEEIIRDLRPELVILGDTRIIKPNIIALPVTGVVNVHPGYLPDVRGNNPYIWSIIHGLPQGCTVHFIDQDIDTGPIILRRRIHPGKGWTFPWLLAEINRVCGELLVEGVRYIMGGMTKGIPQEMFPVESNAIRYFELAPPGIRAEAIAKLEKTED